jgi:hypothetical protein
MKEHLAEMTKGFSDQRSRDIMAWTSTLNFSIKQNDFFSRCQEGTGRWLLEAGAFMDWMDGTERTLWCPGLRMILSLNAFQHCCSILTGASGCR